MNQNAILLIKDIKNTVYEYVYCLYPQLQKKYAASNLLPGENVTNFGFSQYEHISKLWLLKNDFFICVDTKHGKRAHKRFLTDELGPENENNLQIGKVTWGHKYLRFCLKSSLEFFLSLPLTFPIYLIIYQYPKYHQSTGNMTFRLLTSKIDVLPISQDFPSLENVDI